MHTYGGVWSYTNFVYYTPTVENHLHILYKIHIIYIMYINTQYEYIYIYIYTYIKYTHTYSYRIQILLTSSWVCRGGMQSISAPIFEAVSSLLRQDFQGSCSNLGKVSNCGLDSCSQLWKCLSRCDLHTLTTPWDLSICLSVCLSTYLSIYLSTYLSI